MEEIKQKKIEVVKDLLLEKTGCTLQCNDEWCCRTCFFAISEKFTNKDWQTILYIRGDYKKEELDNLPKNIDKRLDRIIKILNK